MTDRGAGGRRRSGRGRSGEVGVTDGGDTTLGECVLGVLDMRWREGTRLWDDEASVEWENYLWKYCSLLAWTTFI